GAQGVLDPDVLDVGIVRRDPPRLDDVLPRLIEPAAFEKVAGQPIPRLVVLRIRVDRAAKVTLGSREIAGPSSQHAQRPMRLPGLRIDLERAPRRLARLLVLLLTELGQRETGEGIRVLGIELEGLLDELLRLGEALVVAEV